MLTTTTNLEKVVNSGLTIAIKKSEINFDQLYLYIKIEDLLKTILFLKNNEKCKFKQLIDITAVDYPKNEKRFKLIYLLLSHENNLRIVVNTSIDIKDKIPKRKACTGEKNTLTDLICKK